MAGVQVHLVPLEVHLLDARPGFWCPACALPSAVEHDAALVDPCTLLTIVRITQVVCEDCGRQWPACRPRSVAPWPAETTEG